MKTGKNKQTSGVATLIPDKIDLTTKSITRERVEVLHFNEVQLIILFFHDHVFGLSYHQTQGHLYLF